MHTLTNWPPVTSALLCMTLIFSQNKLYAVCVKLSLQSQSPNEMRTNCNHFMKNLNDLFHLGHEISDI